MGSARLPTPGPVFDLTQLVVQHPRFLIAVALGYPVSKALALVVSSLTGLVDTHEARYFLVVVDRRFATV